MNKHTEIDLKPYINDYCRLLGTSKDEIMSRRFLKKNDITKQILFYLLYFKVKTTYKNIANEFSLTPQAVYFSVKKASERIDDGQNQYLQQLGIYK